MVFDHTAALVILALVLMVTPLVHYLVRGIRDREREILSLFTDAAIEEYFLRYLPVEKRPDGGLRTGFRTFYRHRFGLRVFLPAAVVFTVLVCASVTVMVGAALGQVAGWQTPDLMRQPVIASALAGAYLWVFVDLLGGLRAREITPATLYGSAFRFAISVPLAFALASLFTPSVQVALAFMLGAFPTTTLVLFMRRWAAQRLGMGSEAETTKHELEQLQGVNTALAERFAEIGVTTILRLAFEDPIQLGMRMNLPIRDVVDLMSQALGALYIPRFDVYHTYLVRSSIDCTIVVGQLRDTSRPDLQALARTQVDAIAAELTVDPRIVEKIMHEVDDDSANQFFVSLWQQIAEPRNRLAEQVVLPPAAQDARTTPVHQTQPAA